MVLILILFFLVSYQQKCVYILAVGFNRISCIQKKPNGRNTNFQWIIRYIVVQVTTAPCVVPPTARGGSV